MRKSSNTQKGYLETKQLLNEKKLHTVCEEAACPNIGECYGRRSMQTVMI